LASVVTAVWTSPKESPLATALASWLAAVARSASF
jgi:hypothetical protein